MPAVIAALFRRNAPLNSGAAVPFDHMRDSSISPVEMFSLDSGGSPFGTAPNDRNNQQKQSEQRYRQSMYDAAGNQLFDSTLDYHAPLGLISDADRLDPFNKLSEHDSPEWQRQQAQRVYDVTPYGDATQNLFVLAVGADLTVLTAPRGKRIYLVIQNQDVANSVRFAFDDDSTARGLILRAGESVYMSAAVPQNDLHMCAVAGTPTVCVMYVNTDLTQRS